MPVEDPGSGGGVEYAGAYNILDSDEDVELLGIAKVKDVQQILVQALPSNVVFHLRFPRDNYVPSIVASLTRQFAGYFNALAALPGVASVSTFQDTTAGNQIQDVMAITVRTPSGVTHYTMEETQFGRRLDFLGEEIAAKVAELSAIETGH